MLGKERSMYIIQKEFEPGLWIDTVEMQTKEEAAKAIENWALEGTWRLVEAMGEVSALKRGHARTATS
jgi:hypothetical protein